MNNNIIKSLRQTLLCTVAAAAVSIGFMACSSDETFVTQNATATAPAQSYRVIVPANMGVGETRAIVYNDETKCYDALFETNSQINLFNVTKQAWSGKLTDENWVQGVYLYPDANAKTANLIGELSFYKWDGEKMTDVTVVPEVGDALMLFYDKNYAGSSISYNRNFSYGDAEIEYAVATVKITSIEDGVIKTSNAFFEHPQSIYKINFTGIGSGVKIKKVNIESEQNKLVRYYYPLDNEWANSFGHVTYNYEGEGRDPQEQTFMLRFANNSSETSGSGDVITFRAVASDGHYYSGNKTVTNDLENGLYYLADVTVKDAGLALTLTNNTTGEKAEIGEWNYISTKDASYTLENLGFDNLFEWYGGSQTLTLKGVTINNIRGCLSVFTNSEDLENTSVHNLVLDGENTLYRSESYSQAMTVYENSTLHISEASSGGMLTVNSTAMGIRKNAKVILESGVVTINGSLEGYDDSSFIISKGGKLRIANNSYIREGLIKAAEGYVLTVSLDDEYLVYTAIEDDGSGLAKSIVVTPATATLFYSSSSRQGINLRAYVYPETATDKSVTWTTSNPDVVQVEEDGHVYSTGVGTAIVTATTNDGTGLSAKCEITVKPVGGIWYEYENRGVNVAPESKPFINPLVQVGNITSITYTSSDTSVATVNATTGEVTIAAGATVGQSVTITATATVEEDGKYIYPEWRRTDSYTVTLVSATGQGEREDYNTPGTW
jgi:uncharacterized protein YjdB